MTLIWAGPKGKVAERRRERGVVLGWTPDLQPEPKVVRWALCSPEAIAHPPPRALSLLSLQGTGGDTWGPGGAQAQRWCRLPSIRCVRKRGPHV